MTKAEARKLIAERLEPKPEREPSGSGLSVGGFWDSYMSRHHRDDPGIWSEFEAVDFFTSEDASARLLDAMRKAHFEMVDESKFNDAMGDHCWSDLKKLFFELLTDRNLETKTTIVLAAMKWLGIEGELDG